MKLEQPVTKAKLAKIEAMKIIKAAYVKAQKNGEIKSYKISTSN